MDATRAGLLLLILVEAACFKSQGARCKFPSDWKGRYFQSGLGNVIIRDTSITTKGSCVDQHRDYFLFANTRENNCFQCLLVIKRHPNVLQYRESYCLPPDSLKNICAQIRVETPLYTLVRDPSTSIACPFQDAYHFNYNDLLNGFCDHPNSYAKPCIGLNKYLFQFKHCVETATLNRKDFNIECLATWKDGSESYLYSRVTTAGVNVKDDQYRCFNYQHFGSDVFISMSADATCRGLRTARDGQFVMELAKDSFGWPIPSCRFPDWLKAITWRDLEGRQLLKLDTTGQVLVEWYQRKSKQYPQSDYKCTSHVAKNPLAKDVTLRSFSTHGCVSKNQCLRIRQRVNDVVEFQRGNLIDTEANSRCIFTDVYQILINEQLSSPKATCPLSGVYQTVTKDQCVFRLAVGCYNNTIIDVTSTCNGHSKENALLTLECLITWRFSDKDFVIVREAGGKNRLANCLSFTSESRPVMLEMDKSCNRDSPAIDNVFQSSTFTKIDDCKYDFARTWSNKPSSPMIISPSNQMTTARNSNFQESNLPSPDSLTKGIYSTPVEDPNFYEDTDYEDGLDFEYRDSLRPSKFFTSPDDVTSSPDVIDDVDIRQLSGIHGKPSSKSDRSSFGVKGTVLGGLGGGLSISSQESDDDFEFGQPLDSHNFPYRISQQFNVTELKTDRGLGKSWDGRDDRQDRVRHGSGSDGSGDLFRRFFSSVAPVAIVTGLTVIEMMTMTMKE